jgi:endoglucanase
VTINKNNVLTYPDARVNIKSITHSFTKTYNVRRGKNHQGGVNLGLAFMTPEEGDWGVILEESDFDAVQKAGFHYIRLPVAFMYHLNQVENVYQLDQRFLSRLDWAVEKTIEREMVAIIDFHYVIPDDKLTFISPKEKIEIEEKFLAVWNILAKRYRDYPTSLYFELANEPHRPINSELWNTFVQKALVQIRQSGGNNLIRTIVVGANVHIGGIIHSWDQISNIEQLNLPSAEDDPNIMVTFHYYNPYPFTHQEQNYTRDLALISWLWKGHRWVNTDQQIAFVKNDFDLISKWAQKNSRKVILGEFGVSIHADIDSQIRWIKLIRKEAESRGMIWIFWDFYDQDELGALYNQQTGSWRKEILDVLLPEERSYENDNKVQSSSMIPEFVGLLDDPEWTIRKQAVLSLSRSGPDGEIAVPALISKLEDEEWQVRKAVLQALTNLGSASFSAVPILIKILEDEEWQLRNSAIKALAAIGEIAYPALPGLIQLLSDEEWQIRKQAIFALASIAPEDANVQMALLGRLGDSEDQVRQAASETLKTMKENF